MYLKFNMEVPPCNYGCSRKAIILNILCVFVALFVQQAMRMNRIKFISAAFLTVP